MTNAAQTDSTPSTIYLKDYTPPPFLVSDVALDFAIHADGTLVTAKVAYQRNPQAKSATLVLNGEALETLSIKVDERSLTTDEYQIRDEKLYLDNLPDAFTLETQVRIQPDQNTQLSGLYRSRDGYFTQCEAQGFRRITWFQDRPDVMASFIVTVRADKATFPELLSNGNLLETGDEDGGKNGRHYAVWQDPHKKPCYLFALVAAKLDVLRDDYTTSEGRQVRLAIYVEPGKLDQCPHAMAALKKSMKWDEDTFGLAYDLDDYMIVAVGDFNMGAMENKGLNIFNTKYVLARADVATDQDFLNIDRVVAHEYFHNWTGNRVTCRDWFQLSLKEGLTVFRDQEFGADMHNRTTSRIEEVRGLRAGQLPEDAGPMAHPVRPESYVEINNFYTATVYQKGAEVVRMIRTLIGKANFRKGMDVYFARHDGQAVRCEEFVAAMADASGFDFSPFMTWYRQAGTPSVSASSQYDAAAKRYTLTLRQRCAPSPGQPDKAPYLIPFAIGLLGPDGQDMDLGNGITTQVLHFVQPEQTFVFDNIAEQPVPSLLRDFSAPITLSHDYSDAELAHLLAHDSDPFNRWEAGQRLFGRLILAGAAQITQNQTPLSSTFCPDSVIQATAQLLNDANTDPAFIAEALTMPSEATLAEQMAVVDPEALYQARVGLIVRIATALESDFARLYEQLAPRDSYRPDAAEISRRRLRNLCLSYLNEANLSYQNAAQTQYAQADNMTDQLAALTVLANAPGDSGNVGNAGKNALADFYQRWQHEALVVDKWLVVQSTSRLPDTLANVQSLTSHPAFDIKNPNKVYSLLRAFGNNHRHFHAADGSGYRFIAEQIRILDPMNPQVASRLARCFDRWKKFDEQHQRHARAALQSLKDQAGLSRDVYEVVEKALG